MLDAVTKNSVDFTKRNFMILDVSEIGSLNFGDIMETSPESLRKSVNETKTFVKWKGEKIPNSVNNLKTKVGPYSYDDMIKILSTPEWS
tara:strand:- start:503 stop:769 length:267 start_codon:yes stop_codon:yes gene_type:complete